MVAHRIQLHIHKFDKLLGKKYFHPTRYYNSKSTPWLDPETKTRVVHCTSQLTNYGRNGKVKEAEDLFCTTPIRNVVTWTAMLSVYAKNGHLQKARQLFDQMPQRNVASWNALISAYVSNEGGLREAFQLFVRMPERNEVSYATMIAGFANAGMFREAERLYCQNPRECRARRCSNVLIVGFLKMGQVEKAENVFRAMEDKDVVSWSSMLHGYCVTGKLGEARKLFDEMEERNVVTWVSMINGYLKMGFFDQGFELFGQMLNEGVVKVSSVQLTCLFRACGLHGRYAEARQIHGLYLCLGFDSDVLLGHVVITMYWRFGLIDECRKVWAEIKHKSVIPRT